MAFCHNCFILTFNPAGCMHFAAGYEERRYSRLGKLWPPHFDACAINALTSAQQYLCF